MEVLTEQHEDAVTIRVEGELDMGTSRGLEDALRSAVESGGAIALDLSKCSFIDSSAVVVIVEAAHWLASSRRTLRIVGLSGQPKELFDLTLLNQMDTLQVE